MINEVGFSVLKILPGRCYAACFLDLMNLLPCLLNTPPYVSAQRRMM